MEESDIVEQEVKKEDKPVIDKGFLSKQGHGKLTNACQYSLAILFTMNIVVSLKY